MKEEIFEKYLLSFLVVPLAVSAVFSLFFGPSTALFLASASVGLGLSIWSPRSGVLAAVLLTTIFAFSFTLQLFEWGGEWYKLYPIDVLLLGSILGVAARLITRRYSLRWSAPDMWMLFFLIWVTAIFVMTTVHLFGDATAETAFSTWKNFVFYGMLYFLVPILFRTREQAIQLGKVFLFGCAVSLIFLVIGILTGQALWTEYTPLSTEGSRYLDFSHAFYFSMAVLIIAFFRGVGQGADIERKGLSRILMLLWVIGIAASLMRHLWLGLILVIAGMMIFLRQDERANLLRGVRRLTILLVSMVFFVIYLGTMLQNISWQSRTNTVAQYVTERISSLQQSQSDESIVWRNVVWHGALDAFSQSPFIGAGFGAKIAVDWEGYSDFVDVRNIHNSWLSTLVQTGIIGFFLIAGLLISLLRRFVAMFRKAPFANRSVQLSILAVFLLVLFVPLFQPYLESNFLNIFFWINLGLMRWSCEGEKRV